MKVVNKFVLCYVALFLLTSLILIPSKENAAGHQQTPMLMISDKGFLESNDEKLQPEIKMQEQPFLASPLLIQSPNPIKQSEDTKSLVKLEY